MAIGVHRRDDQRAGFQRRDFGGRGTPHLEQDIRAQRFGRRSQARAGGLIFGVGQARFQPGAGLDRDLGPERDELLDRFRARGDARLARIGFSGDPNQHDEVPSS